MPKLAVTGPVDATVIVPEFAVVVTVIACVTVELYPDVKAPFNTILSAAVKLIVPSVAVTVLPALTVNTPALVAATKLTPTLPVIFPPTVKASVDVNVTVP